MARVCYRCKWFEICQYRNNEGVDLSALIRISEEECLKFKEGVK